MTDIQAHLEFYRQVFLGSWITQATGVVAELGIADLLAHSPQTAQELARQTQTHGGSLYRLLRALASIGIFAEDAQGRFVLTPRAELLRSDGAVSQRAFAIMMGAEFHETWGDLLHSVKTGKPGFEKRFGVPFFHYMTDNPGRHGIYDRAMMGVHGAETGPVLDAYDFSVFESVVDIGGGNGSALTTILSRHPALQGILFDLPGVVERARPLLAASGLSEERCRAVGGDFFESVPPGADAYLMRHVIHDWQDADAVRILRSCREAMRPGGRVLVVESVIPRGNDMSFGKWLDLMMLLVDGRERTEEEYSHLFSAAGLVLTRVIPTAAEVSVIEGMRA